MYTRKSRPIDRQTQNLPGKDAWYAEGKKKSASLRSRTIRLAHANPGLRPYLLKALSSPDPRQSLAKLSKMAVALQRNIRVANQQVRTSTHKRQLSAMVRKLQRLNGKIREIQASTGLTSRPSCQVFRGRYSA